MHKYMFLKKKKPEMEDFERKKKIGSKEKYLFLTDTLAKILKNIFAYSFVSEHSKDFLNFETRITFFYVLP